MQFPKTFEAPVQIGDSEWIVTVTINACDAAGGDGWNEPRYPRCPYYTLESIRRAGGQSCLLGDDTRVVLEASADWPQACLDAIDDFNQPPGDTR